MLEVHPIQNKLEQEALCARCGVAYKVETLAYRASVDGELVGICQFSLAGGKIARIQDLAQTTERREAGTDDREPLFVMGRAALNFCDLCGVHHARFDNSPEEGSREELLLLAIGFCKSPAGIWEMDLTDFFIEPCKHTKAKPDTPAEKN